MQYYSNINQDPFNDPFFVNARKSILQPQQLYQPGEIYNPQISIPGIQNDFHSVFITPPEIPEDEEYSQALRDYEEQRDKLEKMEKNILEMHKKAVEKQRMRNSQMQSSSQQQQNQQQNYSTQPNYDSQSLAKDFSNLKTPSQQLNMPYSKSTIHTDNSLNNSRHTYNQSQNRQNQNLINSRNQYSVQQPGNTNNLINSNQFLNVQQPYEPPRRSSFYESFEKIDTIINENGEKVVTKKIETNQDGMKNIQVHEQIFNQQGQLISDNIWNEKPAIQSQNEGSQSNISRNNTLNSIPMETSGQYRK
ncbi:hypothetical protein PPERSA_08028 [Pseudocohnilembus persalinus]|uniref:Uncharacterized protein n=1 Tax=Pseudocohnilembus persalinus TaxID=266149 RepID=A0A0V0R2T5_PSEPJ|nr:hypothetical protein PPERSA_08028 [Pseudocohnilembus persalinus]|eukprot:KRX08717.1 hypothetical protein PPERSA_08028 [Pseudocohnilembus persalinus]